MASILPLFLVLLAAPAVAGPVEDAEAVRLSTELRKEVEVSAWAAADDRYRKLAAVPGVDLSFDDHWRGYVAAEALGDANAQYQRLTAAARLQPTDDVFMAQARLMAWYGPVELMVARKADPRPVLTMVEVPMDPAQRRVFEAAAQAIAEDGRYQGLLPLGQYHLGEVAFDVVGESVPVRVKARR